MSACRLNKSDLTDIIITAYEGGIDYWCTKARAYFLKDGETKRYAPLVGEDYEEFVIDRVGAYANPEFWEGKKRGYFLWFEEDEKPKLLTIAKLRAAFDNEYFADEKGKKILKKFNNPGEYDAWDADVIVQIAVFGEVVYG